MPTSNRHAARHYRRARWGLPLVIFERRPLAALALTSSSSTGHRMPTSNRRAAHRYRQHTLGPAAWW
jgi:hypothetical protein